jgi:glycosyltransferase involved in cell wall biosynthesis
MTGIERIGGEICKYLPPNSAIAVRLHSDRLVALPAPLIGAIGRYFADASESGAAEIKRLSAVENAKPISVLQGDTVLVPEIFAGERAEFFDKMPQQELERCRFIIYDLLPMTHPEYFLPDMPVILSKYFQVVRRVGNCGFISEYSREMYYQRLKRTAHRGGVVLPLGSDAFGARATQRRLNRPLTFSVLGTIEPRKNHQIVLDAFEPLLRQIEGLRLHFIGKIGWVDSELAQRVQTLASDKNSGFRFFPTLADGAIRSCIEQSRATIYVSAAEGYGLPPVESLWLGTPVIASSTIPSLRALGAAGIHCVEPLTVENLRRAVLAFLDDTYANQKTEEAMQVSLPTWRSFTQEVLHWCAQEGD